MTMKPLFAIGLSLLLAAATAYPQAFPAQGNDNTQSMGVFQIKVDNSVASLFTGCPGYNSTTKTFTSPTLYDPATVISRSNPTGEGDAEDATGVTVGPAGSTVVIGDTIMTPPSGFGSISTGTREVHTEVHSLNMVTFPAGGPIARVRAGLYYNDPSVQSPPARLSPGEVVSNTAGGGSPDFPARSYFDVFVRIDVPGCGGLPASGATLYNQAPLLVSNNNLTSFPPDVVYLHDTSSSVWIYFKDDAPGKWTHDQVAGYVLLAGHGVGATQGNAKNAEQVTAFRNQVLSRRPAPPPPCNCPRKGGGLSAPAISVLGGLAAVWIGIVLFRRRRLSLAQARG